MTDRCINYDWVEVFCIEDDNYPARTPDYYMQECGRANVEVRDYGSPMYKEMFTICFRHRPLIEVRRNPLSKKSQGGIFPDNCCHVRLSNRVCYYADPIGFLLSFLKKHHLVYSSTKRIDIALDFNEFDSGDDPAAFLRRYHANRYAKMYQREFNDHGSDGWQTKLYNSIKWGSTASDINTKLYNKSMELSRQGHDKPYIRERWEECKLDLSRDVWRVEYSIQSSLKNLVSEEDGATMPIDIMCFRTREMCLNMFMMLSDRYFDFRYVEKLPNGKLQRKDRCRRKELFNITPEDRAYRPFAEPSQKLMYDRTLFQVVERMAHLAERDTDDVRSREAIRRTAEIIVKNYAVDDFHLNWLNRIIDIHFPYTLFDEERSDS